MPVKDLVGLFESDPDAASSTRRTRWASTAPTTRESVVVAPTPRPARFLQQPQRLDDDIEMSIPPVGPFSHPSFMNIAMPFNDPFDDLHTADVTEEATIRLHQGMPSWAISAANTWDTTSDTVHDPDPDDDNEEHRVLIPPAPSPHPSQPSPSPTPSHRKRSHRKRRSHSSDTYHPHPSEPSHRRKHSSSSPHKSHRYPPQDPDTPPRHKSHTHSTHRRRNLTPHKPVPATVVFARGAAPLHLPKLDKYLESIDPPSFKHIHAGKGKQIQMFPPMEKLSASKMTVDDLEHNSKPPTIPRSTVLGSALSGIIGVLGSSALASYYTLKGNGLLNTVQMFALILTTIVPIGQTGAEIESRWKSILLGKIPQVLALNFASTLTESLIFLLVFMALAAVLLFFFFRWTRNIQAYDTYEGLQQRASTGHHWGLVIVTFLITTIYLPLSTLAMHVLVWSSDLWVVPNPYINATVLPPVLPPLGPSNQFRDSLDFCWTTTMSKDEINFAPVFIIVSILVVGSLTVWFPIRLRHVIQKSVPKVDPYTELGRSRSESDMDREYQRLLARDTNPFAFLYRGFRRNWGAFEATYLIAKFSTLFIIAAMDPYNCLFRTLNYNTVSIVRQVVLLVSTLSFFINQCFLHPFLDPINNASEWTSRLNYLLTSIIALLVILVPTEESIWDGAVLYTVYGITYGLSFYFTLVDTSFMQNFIKRTSHRIDFSIDIFSPRLDIGPNSIHIRRRIWQESITALFLTNPDCKIPPKQIMEFVQAPNAQCPPYLVGFMGTPGERHVENLKILREVGSLAYTKAVALASGPDHAWFRYMEAEIQNFFIGPDCYWNSPSENASVDCTKYFGNAWWIPFPPTLVIRYDDGPLAILNTVVDFESYIAQNSSSDIRRRREIRMSIRALDGLTVVWPYEYVQPIGKYSIWCCGNGRYEADTTRHFQTCKLRLIRKGDLPWDELNLASGFEVELVYAKDVHVDGTVIGLNDDYDLTAPLARFLTINQDLIPPGLERMQQALDNYRDCLRKEVREKSQVLTYRFLTFVYNQPRDPTGLAESSIEFERDLRVRQLMVANEAVFEVAYDRLAVVSASGATRWWYIFWDDFWRRNNDTVPALKVHETDFNPHYPTSIAYTPLPRSALKAFLTQRGLLSVADSEHLQKKNLFYSGFLNKIYFRLNDIVFAGSNKAIMVHVGSGASEVDVDDIQTQGGPSTLGTGGGTDYDDDQMRPRPEYRWEALLTDTATHRRGRRFWSMMGAWFGVTPLWRASMPTKGISLDVYLKDGRYHLVEMHDNPFSPV